MTGYLRETKEAVRAQARDLDWENEVECSPLALSFQRGERLQSVAVGRIRHHCRVPSPAAFLLPRAELCS